MNLVIYGIQSIVAHGLLTISDKLEFIGQANIISDEEQLIQLSEQGSKTIAIVSFEQYFSSPALQQSLTVNKSFQLILVADLYRLQVEKIDITNDLSSIIICKDCKEYEFIHALYAAKESDKYFCSEILNYILSKSQTSQNQQKLLVALTEREIEVLKLIGKGYSSNQIAENLFISRHTVNSHRKRIMQKLNLKKPAQLIKFLASNSI